MYVRASTLQDVTSNAGTVDNLLVRPKNGYRKHSMPERGVPFVATSEPHKLNISIYLCYPDISSTCWHKL